jgi:hypothetical protein
VTIVRPVLLDTDAYSHLFVRRDSTDTRGLRYLPARCMPAGVNGSHAPFVRRWRRLPWCPPTTR